MTIVDEGPLKDIADIINLKPDLTDEEKVVVEKIKPQLKAMLKTEIRVELDAEYAKKAKQFQDDLTQASREAVQNAIKSWKDEQEPLSQDDISKLLSQDYINFEVNFKLRHPAKTVNLNLVELPQAIEERFLKVLKRRFIPLIKNLSASEMKLNLDGDTMDKLQSLLEAAPDVLDVLAELVAICLDPFGDIKEYGEINEAWVKNNMSTQRILAVIIGQMEVQRYRDFFLNGFRLSKSLKQTR